MENKKHVFFSVYVCGEECQKTLEVGKKLKRVKRVTTNVISLAKIVVLDVPEEF
jgi:predicted nucleic acid-binding Zn ribbon protein